MRGGIMQWQPGDPGMRGAKSQGMTRRAVFRLASHLAATGLLMHGNAPWFEALAGELRSPQDPRHPTPFEQMHLPSLQVPSFTHNGSHVPIVVEMAHPMEPDHYITSLSILNPSDPIPSKGILHLTPDNGQAYLGVQARMHSGSSSVVVVAECNRHGRWAAQRSVTVSEDAGGCATATDEEISQFVQPRFRPPVIRIPKLVRGQRITPGEVVRVQLKLLHPNRTGLAWRDGAFHQAVEDPLYLKHLQVFYGDRPVSRYEMTPALSDNPLIALKLRVAEEGAVRMVITNSRGEQFQAQHEIRWS